MTTITSERDVLREDGSIDWRVVRCIAMARADAERDLEIFVAVYGPHTGHLPAGISQHNVRHWRAKLAMQALRDNPTLTVTPILDLYRIELKRIWSTARMLQAERVNLMAALRGSVALLEAAE